MRFCAAGAYRPPTADAAVVTVGPTQRSVVELLESLRTFAHPPAPRQPVATGPLRVAEMGRDAA
jgi:hypothetical protein